MSAIFDHIAISCETLRDGVHRVERSLGCSLEPGGRHPVFGTHNMVLSLGPGEYLEVIAIDPGAPAPGRARWFDLDRFSGQPRVTNWIVRVEDLSAVDAPGEVLDLDRGAYRWRMAVPVDGVLPLANVHPATIEWCGPHPAEALPDNGIRLHTLVLRHPEPDRLERLPGTEDPRVRIEGGAPGLSAGLATPRGLVWL